MLRNRLKNKDKRPYKKVVIKPVSTKNVIQVDDNQQVKPKEVVKPIKRSVIKRPKAKIDPRVKRIKNHDVKRAPSKKFRQYKKIGVIEPVFKGETIYLIGGGPSLKGFDFERLRGKVCIAINKAFLHVPFAQVAYWTDTRVYHWYRKQIGDFVGLKVTNKPRPIEQGIINLLDTGKTGLELNNNALRHGNNSGYAAINLAYHLGAKKIVLLGFDMGLDGRKTHWHEGYNIPTPRSNLYESSMLPNFETLVEPLKKQGISIINANPKSAINCFKKMPLDSALNL